MAVKKISYRRFAYLGVLSVMAIPIALLFTLQARSLQIQDRSVSLSSSIPGATIRHMYTFSLPSTAVVGSISLEYCTNSPLAGTLCTAPAGFDASASTLTAQTTNTGFSIDAGNTTANRLVLTRPAAAGVTGASSYTFDGMVSPSASNQTVYVRIATHASTDGTGASNDEGALAFSTGIDGFGVGAYVPPYMTFCVGQTVALNCSSAGSVLVDFGEFSDSNESTATIQFSIATNDFSGYNVYMFGQTLTSGNAIIPAMTSQAGSSVGTSQFGANLRSNTNPSVGANEGGPGTGIVDPDYNSPNQFRFVSGDRIAYSPISSDFSRFTISYLTNVSEDQPPGIYATTLSYMAVATF